MPTRILIPTPLRMYTNKQDSVLVDGSTAGELLQQLTSRFPVLKKHLFADNGELRSYVNVYVNEDDIRYLQKEKTPVSEKDVVRIIPSIAGGDYVPESRTSAVRKEVSHAST